MERACGGMISSRAEIGREDVASHYDDLDYFYRDVWGDHVHHGFWRTGRESREQAVLQLVDLVAEKAGVGNGVRVCDIGCGYGATARVLADRGAQVTGITLSPAQFAIAAQGRSRGENPAFLLGDWLTSEIPADSFDAAIAIESSEHMPDKSAFFAQAHRVLRTDGRLVICAWLAAEQPGAQAESWLLEPICREGRMPHLGSASDYKALGEAAEFRLLSFEDITTSVARTWPAIVWRLMGKLITAPRYIRFLFSRHAHNRIFALTILRIWIAYCTGAMRYGIFTFVK